MSLSKRQIKQIVTAVSSLIVIIISGLSLTPAGQKFFAPASPGTYRVTKAIDGDTIEVSINGKTETVRFIGVDTPETHDPRKPVQCFGEVAAAHTKKLVEGASVRLEADPTNSDRDKYKRLLRYVYLPDGTLLNAELIQDGYGFAYVIFPFTKLDEFRTLETSAREANRGLWAGCDINSGSDIKQTTTTK
jgi:micrococcal nuclease